MASQSILRDNIAIHLKDRLLIILQFAFLLLLDQYFGLTACQVLSKLPPLDPNFVLL